MVVKMKEHRENERKEWYILSVYKPCKIIKLATQEQIDYNPTKRSRAVGAGGAGEALASPLFSHVHTT